MKRLICLPLLLVLAACGKSLEGRYVLDAGVGSSSLRFSAGGKVVQGTTVLGIGTETETRYRIEGDTVRIGDGQSLSLVLKILPDGQLEGPLGLRYVKQAQ